MSGDIVTLWDTYLTMICSLLSLIGSILVLFSYLVTKSTANPRAAQLICNLALTDFVWFLSAFVQTLFWVTDSHVPAWLCFIVGPLVNFCRLASLMWTCAISIDVLMSVKHRKWTRNGEEGERQSVLFKRIYFAMVIIFASPNFIITIVLQHMSENNSDLGCNPGYEEIGDPLAVFFTDILPIAIGFAVNVYVFLVVRSTMNQKAYPQSVRKRRRKIMYHYVIVCIVSWTPTIAHYILCLCGIDSAALEVTARGSLYLTGFLNFLVFGMQDPHLSRSLAIIIYALGFEVVFGGSTSDDGVTLDKSNLRIKEEQKSVMFTGHMEEGADIAKDKKDIYKYHKLSEEDKASLYRNRPDLNPRLRLAGTGTGKKKPKRRMDSGVADVSPLLGVDDAEDDEDGGEWQGRRSSGSSQLSERESDAPSSGSPASMLSFGGGRDVQAHSLSEPLLAQPVAERDSAVEQQLRRSLSRDYNRPTHATSGLVEASSSEKGHSADYMGDINTDRGPIGSSRDSDSRPGSHAVPESKSTDMIGMGKDDGGMGMTGGDLETGEGSDTPATVSIDSRDGSTLGGGGFMSGDGNAGDSSSDEGDEEDDALELPLGGSSGGLAQ